MIVILHDHTCYPVNSDALHPANTVGYHIFPPRLIPLGSADGTQTHVHPVDCVILWRPHKNGFKNITQAGLSIRRPLESLTSVEVDANSQRGSRNRHQGIRFVCWVERNSSDSLVNRVKQERAHACSERLGYWFLASRCTSPSFPTLVTVAVSYLHRTVGPSWGCIRQCTCRPWLSERWANTAVSSHHCCYCTGWHRLKKRPEEQRQTFSLLVFALNAGDYIHFRTCNSFPVTFLHILIIDPHVHHWGGVVSQNFPVSSILLVTCSYLVSSLIGPPQLVSYIIDVTRI